MAANQLLLLLVLLPCLPHADSVGEGIINGAKAKNKSFQYMVSVQLDNKHLCGGFLITDTFVLTAAHCSRYNLTVVLGTHNIKPDKKLSRLNVKRKIEHPDYQKKTLANDIMLLQLSKKVKYGQTIKSVKIPIKDTPIAANSECHVAGWGNTQTNGKTVDDLHTVAVTTINAKVCIKEWEQIKRNIPANTICAGGNTRYGACQGDSGGPLVCSGTAVGIVSFNHKKDCDYPNLPNVYTQISKFLPWIEKNIRRKV